MVCEVSKFAKLGQSHFELNLTLKPALSAPLHRTLHKGRESGQHKAQKGRVGQSSLTGRLEPGMEDLEWDP